MRHKSRASKLRTRLSTVVESLAELVKTLPVRRFKQGGAVVFVGPQLYFGDRSTDQQAVQFALKREYEVLSELLKLIIRGGPTEIVGNLKEADEHFREWLDLNGSWSVTADPTENARQVRAAAEPLERILDVLDLASEDEVLVVPETNSLLAEVDPTTYRQIAGTKFVFMLLPTVLGELDKLKIEHRNPDVRDKAKNVINRIKGWRKQGPLVDGVTVDKTITVRASSREPDFKNTLSWLDKDNNDDRIIASVVALQSEFPSAQVILVSGDINLLNKADVALIETAELP